jgi:hypothetical protein
MDLNFSSGVHVNAGKSGKICTAPLPGPLQRWTICTSVEYDPLVVDQVLAHTPKTDIENTVIELFRDEGDIHHDTENYRS